MVTIDLLDLSILIVVGGAGYYLVGVPGAVIGVAGIAGLYLMVEVFVFRPRRARQAVEEGAGIKHE